MPDIFISYARKDQKWVKRFVAALTQSGMTVWWDPSIPTGKKFVDVIAKNLAESRCVIVVWSKASLRSDWVREEAEEGKSRNILVPVFKEPVQPPLGFRGIQATDLSRWDFSPDTPAFVRLLSDLKVHFGLEATEPPPTAASSDSPTHQSAIGLLPGKVLAVALGAVAFGAILILLFRPGKAGSMGKDARQKLDSNRTAVTPLPNSVPVSLQQSNAFTNTIGMVFVPVPGTDVWFSIWETRVRDFEKYATAQPGIGGRWRNPMFQNVAVEFGPEFPVVQVNWEEAHAFCSWLTEHERSRGSLPKGHRYALPTDLEWSAAVGLRGESGATPAERSRTMQTLYPWGTKWPPPPGSGNFADEATRSQFKDLTVISGYDDGYPTTAPVDRFGPLENGLFGMSGNAQEWCEDWSDSSHQHRVLRGGKWTDGVQPSLLSTARHFNSPDESDYTCGFRVVLRREETSNSGNH